MSALVEITFMVPAAGEKPSGFRGALLEGIRDAIAHAYFDGRLDADRTEECFRALPIEEARR